MADTPEKKLVVLVDDDTDLLKMLSIAFKAKGFDVKEFSSAKEATSFLLEEANINQAALIILDRLLPDGEGIEILKAFHEKFPNHPPVLFLSLLAAEQDVVKGLSFGATDYVTKPFSLPVLMQKATSLIQRNHG